MKILIIGGTGLISKYITRQLLARGDQVTHYNRGESAAQMPEGFSSDAVTLVKGDRTDYPRFEQQLAELGNFDGVLDMVCYEPEDAHSAVRALRGKVGHYLLCSTVDVYTKPASHYPITEAAPRAAIANFEYAQKKVECETIIFQAHEDGEFPVTVIRPGYTYGEGRGTLSSFGWGHAHLDRLRKGKPIIVHGDGTSLWTACHASDEAGAFVGAIGNPVAVGQGYHAPGTEWLPWNELQRQVAEALGGPEPTFVHIPSALLDQVAYYHAHICSVNFQFNNIFDTSAAQRDLGFRYTITWREGVRRVIQWLDQHQAIDHSEDEQPTDQVIAAWQRLCERMGQELSPIQRL